jgi:site-specific recombinase XerD
MNSMPELRLTDISVRALKSAPKPIAYWDTITPGFCVFVGVRRKTFCVVRGRQRQRVTIGHYPDVSVADARGEAKKLLAAVNDAPRMVRKTFKEARDEFLAEHYADKGADTKYQVKRSLERHFKALEALDLADIEDKAIRRCLDKLKDRPSARLHAFRYLRTFFNWCARAPRRYVTISPLQGYETPGSDRRGTRILSDEEIVAIWETANSPRTAIFRAMLLLGTRNTETCKLEREWLVDGVLTIPGEHTKNGRDHAIPLTPLAEHILSQALGTNQHYFAGRWDEGHITPGALGKLKREVMEASDTADWQLRDLRRTFRSLAARVGVRREIAELLINHAPPILDDIYDRYSYVPEKREALLKIHGALLWLLARV